MNDLARRRIGKSSLRVTEIGLGGAGLGNMYRAVEDDAALDTIDTAFRRGVRYFDTAPCYGFGLSELRMGARLSTVSRADMVISTKVGYSLEPLASGEEPWSLFDRALPYRAVYDFSREAVKRSFEESLVRLKMDRVDMVAIHDPDEAATVVKGADPYGKSHFKEAMEGAYLVLDDLRRQGVISAIGVGINQWEMLVDFAKAGDFDYFLLAGRYTLLEQESLSALFPICEQRDISIVLGGPFNSGILASGAVEGAYYNYHPATPDILERVRRMEAVCRSHNVPLPAAALQFPLAHPIVASVIPGPRSVSEFEANISYFRHPIPAGLWADLKTEGLIDRASPCPS